MTKYYGREILNGEVGIQTVTESYLLVTLKIKLIKLGHSISMDKLQRRPELLFSMVVFFHVSTRINFKSIKENYVFLLMVFGGKVINMSTAIIYPLSL